MPQQFDVCVRGDGVVGLSLALLLANERLKVALVAAPAPPHAGEDVRAYALNGAAKNLLESLRAWPEAPFVTPVRDMQVWSGEASQTASAGAPATSSPASPPSQLDFSADSVAQLALAWIVDVPALEQQLNQAVRFQSRIERVQAPVKAALQVICEGQKSSSRDEFGASWTVKPYGQKAVAARLQSDKPHLGVARQWFVRGEILALLPLGGAEGNSLALVWSVSAERAQALQKLSSDDFCAALQADCGHLPGQLSLTSERAAWPLSLASADRWVGPGWALAGDAAHAVHPLAGQGLNLGLGDISALARILKERPSWRSVGDPRLLRQYERERKSALLPMGMTMDALQQLFARQESPLQALRNWGMRGFEMSGPFKEWVARQAMGLQSPTKR